MIQTPNEAQKRALEIRTPRDMIVSAAAGSGKTAVMVDRAVRLIEAGMPIGRLLMTTFTNAAAAEMKQRLAKELLDCADRSAPPAAQRLRSQALLAHSADICTIDSFCIQLARRYFYLVDLDPMFGLMDESTGLVLRAQALEDVFNRYFTLPEGEERTRFLSAIKALCYGREEDLKAMILQIYEYKQTLPDGEAWLKRARAHYADPKIIRQDFGRYSQSAHALIKALYEKVCGLISLLEDGCTHKNKEAILQPWLQNEQALAQLSASPIEEQTLSVLQALQIKKDARIKKSLSAEENAAFDGLHKQIKALVAQCKKEPVFAVGPEGFISLGKECVPVFDSLCELLQSFEQTYTEAKQQANLWDFSDIAQAALRILQNPEARAQTSAQYDAVFIDEVQDTNELQDAILSLIARPRTSFRVGDVKQSIYYFRHTDPSLFLARYHAFSPEENAEQQRIDLKENYRSCANVLHGVNWIMQRCMQPPVSDVAYDDSQALVPGRKEQGPPIRLHLMLKQRPETDDPTLRALSLEDSSVAQARVAAGEIRRLLNQTFLDKGVERPYTLSDIVVLVQTRTHVAPFVQTLQEEGIEAVSDASAEILTTQECGAMLQVLRVVDSLQDDIDFVTALRSPVGQMEAADLVRIRLYQKQQQAAGALPERCEFFQAARHMAQHEENETAQRLQQFFQRLEAYRRYAHRHSVDELILYLYDDCNALAFYGVQPDGAQKTENLIALWQRAQGYAQTGDGSLYGFLQMLDTAAKLGGKEPPQLPTGGDYVRIMTMHTSKGLEFPAVICPFLEQSLYRKRKTGVPLSKKYGIGLKRFHQKTLSRQQTLCYALAEAETQRAETAERMRLCYVAMTRAKEQLILIGQDSEKNLAVSAAKPPQEAISMLDWILPAVAIHPDGAAIREKFGLDPSFVPSAPGAWEVLFSSVALAEEKMYQPKGNWQRFIQQAAGKEDVYSEALQPLYYQYPYKAATAPAKISASQLSHACEQAQAPELSWPAWEAVAGKAPDAAQRGTYMHRAMQNIDLAQAQTQQQVCAQIQKWVETGFFTKEQADALTPALIVSFANSAMAKRILASGQVLREQPFVLRIPSNLVSAEYPKNETTLLQGMIDLAFWEDDGWVLLDYKTDRMPPEGPNALIARYRGQLASYRAALTKLTGRPVKQCALVLLRYGNVLEIDS